MTKKLIYIILVIVMASSFLAGCGGGTGGNVTEPTATVSSGQTAPQKTYDLVFWVYSDVVLAQQGELMNKWVADFISKNPDVSSITLVPKNDTELLTSLMAGVGLPDAFFASARDGKKYMQAIDLLNLKDMYDADPAYTAGFMKNAIDAITVDGGMWAIPFISYIPIIYRNLTILNQVGIDPNEGIPTWDAFLAQLKQVKDAGFDATHSWASGGYYCTGAILGSDAENLTVGVENGKTTVTAAQVVRTFETLAAITPYTNNMTWGEDATIEAFKTDKLAFILDGPWTEPGIQASGVNYDVVLVPPYEVGGHTGGLQGWDMMYGVNSGDAAKNDAIIRWLKYLGEYEHEKEWTSYVGRSTLRTDVMDDPEVLVTMMAKVTSQGLKGGMMQMQFFHSNVFWPSPIGDVAPLVASGQLTPQQGAEKFI
jgi:multiple sugar transport system substrate-binding protein